MPEFEQHGWQGFWIPGRKTSGQHGIAVIIKRRFEVDMMSATCRPAVTPPVGLMQEPYDDGDPPYVSMRAPGEIAIEKPRVDIIVRATAFAPGGKPLPQFDVEMRIPKLVQSKLRIFGDRHLIWYPPVKWLTPEDLAKGEPWIWPDPDFSEPVPIAKLPIRYEYAFGGWAKIIMTPDVQALAADAQAIGAVVEERREKKKEILEQLKKEEEAKGKKEEKPKPKGDEKAAKLAEKAFADAGGEQKLDDETAKKLAEEEAKDDGMKIVSAYRLGHDTPDTAEEADAAKAAEAAKEAAAKKKAKEDAGEEEEKAPPKEEDPNAKFFSGGGDGATSMFDVSKMNLEDELAGVLDDRAKVEARKLKDEEGTLRDRATEFGDIELIDDSWAAKYINARPEKKKKKVEQSDIPQMPYPTNLAGKGFVVSHMEAAVDKVPLPNIEDPNDLLQPEGYIVEMLEFDLNKLRTPAGWGVYPLGAYPRGRYWGPYTWDLDAAKKATEKAKEEFDEEDPDDKMIIEAFNNFEMPLMNPLAFQESHPSLQVKEVRGDEDVYFTNVTPDGNLYFKLPGVHPTVTIDMSEGPELMPLRIDQLFFDLDDPAKPAVEILWRGFYKLKSFEELATKALRKIAIIEVDQDGWLEMQRKMLQKKTGATEGEIDEEKFDGSNLDEEYKAQFKRQKGGKGERLDGISDAVVWDQDDERQIVHEEWEKGIIDEKQAFIDEQKAKAEAAAKIREKILKAKARGMADDEFGILRDPDTGEILAVEPPDKGGGGKKKK